VDEAEQVALGAPVLSVLLDGLGGVRDRALGDRDGLEPRSLEPLVQLLGALDDHAGVGLDV